LVAAAAAVSVVAFIRSGAGSREYVGEQSVGA